MAYDSTALVRAIRDADLAAVTASLARGADPTEVLAQCRTAELARAVIAAGASPDYPPDDPPIVVLAERGYAEALAAVLAAGADIEASRRYTETRALMMAARHGQLPAVRVLLAATANVDARDLVGATALHYAIASPAASRAPIVEALLAAGADRSLQSRNGETPLDVARKVGAVEIVALLG